MTALTARVKRRIKKGHRSVYVKFPLLILSNLTYLEDTVRSLKVSIFNMSNGTCRWEEPIAIVNMACRLPGSINNPKKLWDFVCNKRSSATDVPDTRFNADKFLSMDPNREGLPGVSRGHFIDNDLREFDYRMFGILYEDALAMDPQHKQLLEVVYDCLESTGNPMGQIKGTNIGCYCSIFMSDYHDMQMRDPEHLPKFVMIGTTRSMLSNRISYAFDF